MKRIILLIAFFFLSINFTFAAKPPDFCVRIFVDDKGKETSMGSGILVSDTKVLTNWHVVRDRKTDESIKILFTDWVAVDGKVLKTHKKWDMALIEIKKTDRKPVHFGTPVGVNSVVRIHGYGGGIPDSSCGIVQSTKNFVIVRGTMARSGDSGGCIVNLENELVGILFGQSIDQTYGSDITRINKFLEK